MSTAARLRGTVAMDLGTADRSTARTAPVSTGQGWAQGHHGELLQGVFEVDGRLHRGLTTLPCPMFTTRARIWLAAGQTELTVAPAWKTKALDAVRCTLRALGMPPLGGHLELDGDIEVGRGFGSSSSDVTATIRAVLAAVGRRMTEEEVALTAVAAEAATDPVMFDNVVLFAHREGVPLEDFGTVMCPLEVLGVAVDRAAVDTLALPPARYTPWEIECFRALRGLLRHGMAWQDLRAIGRVATASARVNQRFLPDSRFDVLMAVAVDTRALGVQVAHSGNIAGLLFDPRDPDSGRSVALAARGLSQRGLHETWHYRIGEEGRVDDGTAS